MTGDPVEPDVASSRPLRVAQLPPANPDQPTGFIWLTRQATAAAGVQPARTRLSVRSALRVRDVDVVHLHWLEYLIAAERGPIRGLARSLVRYLRLRACLTIWRRRSIGMVWTIHNLAYHEPIRPALERRAARAAYRGVDDVIVHSRYAREQVAARLGQTRARVHVVPHPNYVAAFPESRASRPVTRARLGLPDGAYVYLAFGQIRAYKRLPELAARFRDLDAPDARLLIVGRASGDGASEQLRQLRACAATDPRIVVLAGHVPDEEVVAIHRAADAAVLAYGDVFSSGALLLALSQGLPVVTPSIGSAQELFAPPAIETFTAGDPLDALVRVRARRGEEQTAAARSAADAYPWSAAGARVADIYRLSGDAPHRPPAARSRPD